MISAAIEAELAVLADPAERDEFLATLGLGETGLDRVIRTGYALRKRKSGTVTVYDVETPEKND